MGRPKVLIEILDEDESRLIELLLHARGYEVITGREDLGKDASDDGHPLVDALIGEPHLVGEPLDELLERLGLPEERLLVLSARNPESLGLPDKVEVLRKPVDVARFLERVRTMIGEPAEDGPERVVGRGRSPTIVGAKVELVLYVHAGTTTATAARRNLEEILQRYPSDRLDLRVVDVAAQDVELDAEDRVVLTPLLVRRNPGPREWLLGDLSDPDKVHRLLGASGLDPATLH